MANRPPDDAPLPAPRKRSPFLGQLLLIVFMAVVTLVAVSGYRDALHKKQEEIIQMISRKGFGLADPEIRTLYTEATMTSWLPTLNHLLASLRSVPQKNTEQLPDNPEKGGYIEYIERHNIPFNAQEALEWQTRSLRKSVAP